MTSPVVHGNLPEEEPGSDHISERWTKGTHTHTTDKYDTPT